MVGSDLTGPCWGRALSLLVSQLQVVCQGSSGGREGKGRWGVGKGRLGKEGKGRLGKEGKGRDGGNGEWGVFYACAVGAGAGAGAGCTCAMLFISSCSSSDGLSGGARC